MPMSAMAWITNDRLDEPTMMGVVEKEGDGR